ncbi:hypothetical protein PIB30_101960, partial [Stylosanthes scabra]|nr:hypothetical protein [Stylosanthes scabra]
LAVASPSPELNLAAVALSHSRHRTVRSSPLRFHSRSEARQRALVLVPKLTVPLKLAVHRTASAHPGSR